MDRPTDSFLLKHDSDLLFLPLLRVLVACGQTGTISSPGDWIRDDRIAGLNVTRGHFKVVAGNASLLAQSLAEKAFAAENFAALGACVRV